MEGEISWVSHWVDNFDSCSVGCNSSSEHSEDVEVSNSVVSMDLMLPDDLLERVLSYLPIDSLLRAGCVCKRWQEIVTTKRFLWNSAHALSQKPWYFMFTGSDGPFGYAYDPILRKWYDIDLPCIQKSDWFIASSCGLVCFMDKDSRSELYVCNPITRCCRGLDEPPGTKFPDYSALAVSVTRATHSYNVSIVESKQVPENFIHWDISIYVYDSETMAWDTALAEVLTGWRGGDESVICDGVLYFLIYSMRDNRHGLVMHNLGSRLSPNGSLMRSFVPMPCFLTCGRLMNLKEKLVMVGGIGKFNRPGIIKGIGIWLLKGREWQEIARMPHKYFQGFGELDEVFASSGTGDLIYIQSYGAPVLLVFDINQKHWRWSQKSPVMKKFPLQLFTGFCFDPRLEIEP